MNDRPRLKTERLWLRPLIEADALHLHDLFSDSEGMRWWHAHPTATMEQTVTVVRTMLKHNAGDWVFGIHGSNAVIGYVGFVTHLKAGGHAGFGYALKRNERGRGYASEAVRCALDYAFNDVGVQCVELWIHRENMPSIQLAKRLGFERRGEMWLNYEKGPTPAVIYGVTKETWCGDTELFPIHQSVEAVLIVSNVKRSIQWWRDVLAFNVAFQHGEPPRMARIVVSPSWTGKSSILIRQREASALSQGEVYVSVGPHIREIAERAETVGAKVVEPLSIRPWGMKEIVLSDPDGNIVTVGTPVPFTSP